MYRHVQRDVRRLLDTGSQRMDPVEADERLMKSLEVETRAEMLPVGTCSVSSVLLLCHRAPPPVEAIASTPESDRAAGALLRSHCSPTFLQAAHAGESYCPRAAPGGLVVWWSGTVHPGSPPPLHCCPLRYVNPDDFTV